MALKTICVGLLLLTKSRKEKIWTSCIVLLSQQPNGTANLANEGGFDSACQLAPQKDCAMYEFKKFPQLLLAVKEDQNYHIQ